MSNRLPLIVAFALLVQAAPASSDELDDAYNKGYRTGCDHAGGNYNQFTEPKCTPENPAGVSTWYGSQFVSRTRTEHESTNPPSNSGAPGTKGYEIPQWLLHTLILGAPSSPEDLWNALKDGKDLVVSGYAVDDHGVQRGQGKLSLVGQNSGSLSFSPVPDTAMEQWNALVQDANRPWLSEFQSLRQHGALPSGVLVEGLSISGQ